MTQRVARDPGLEPSGAGGTDGAAPPWSSGPDGVTIGAARCGVCGTVQVPFQTLGCRHCGSVDLARVDLPARGRLLASVVVWRHPVRTSPYTLGEIELDGGPAVVALLDSAPEGAPDGEASGAYAPGSIVQCTAMSEDEPPLPVFALVDGAGA